MLLCCFLARSRTDASPEELAEYVRAIASTRPNISVEYISNLLLQDGLVNVQGQELTSYISRALDRILGTNGNKVSAAPSSSVVHSSTHPTSSNSRRTTNSSTSNSSRPASYPKKRERDEPQRRQLYQDRTAGGNSSAGTSPKMWQQSARDSYPSGSRHGMNQSNTSSTMSRPSHTAMNSSNSGGGGSGNAYRSRNAPPHSNHTRSTATTTSFNGGGSHPQYHDYSSNATYSQKYNAHSNSNMDEQRRTSPSPSSFKQNQSHNNHRHPHKRNDQYANIAAPPPPPPPPPLPIEEQRTLKLTHVPKSITMVQLSHYFEQHNVTIVSMKLVPSLSDPQLRQHQQQLDPLYHTYVVQCGSHDQANTILQLFPVLGYPCIQITMHPTNLEEGLPELPRPHPSYKPHHQHYVESKMIPTAAVTVTPLNLESEQQQQQQHLLQQEQISSISKTLELKHQQEILLQKQLEMQQKILQKVSDSTEKKGKVLKEILQLQKRLVALRQEILENQNTLATMTSSSTTTTIHLQQEQQSSSPAKRFRLDRRTKKLKVTGYPLEFTTLVSTFVILYIPSLTFLPCLSEKPNFLNFSFSCLVSRKN